MIEQKTGSSIGFRYNIIILISLSVNSLIERIISVFDIFLGEMIELF